ncbi:C-type lectin protein [Toxocara canis]|uniref:C-type lectin protein n=1 Tax=Toxocara canis TaxID=6265 RepID=A0A0B2VLJ0_TOXCA|nr:C-type lectin protein [Toxocara canis]
MNDPWLRREKTALLAVVSATLPAVTTPWWWWKNMTTATTSWIWWTPTTTSWWRPQSTNLPIKSTTTTPWWWISTTTTPWWWYSTDSTAPATEETTATTTMSTASTSRWPSARTEWPATTTGRWPTTTTRRWPSITTEWPATTTRRGPATTKRRRPSTTTEWGTTTTRGWQTTTTRRWPRTTTEWPTTTSRRWPTTTTEWRTTATRRWPRTTIERSAATSRRWPTTTNKWWSTTTTTSWPEPTGRPPKGFERECPCDPARLYLDVVAVVDSSISMTKDGLIEVAADLATVFQRMTISRGSYHGQYVRVSLITFSGYVNVIGNFDSFGNYESLVEALFKMPYHGDNGLNIERALQAASDVLRKRRNYAKTVILLYTSAYSEGGFTDPLPIANQIKESGTKIITVAFRQQPEGSLVEKLAHLASPSFSSLVSMDPDIIDKIVYKFCQVNCYCKNNWMQYANDLYQPTFFYGECVRAMDIDASWAIASIACKSMAPGAHLVSELTYQKHYFVYEYASKVLPKPLKYSVGLRFDASHGKYFWENANNTKVPYIKMYGWNPGYPNNAKGDCVSVAENHHWVYGGYQNEDCARKAMRYVCQMPTCDTDNFCASLND